MKKKYLFIGFALLAFVVSFSFFTTLLGEEGTHSCGHDPDYFKKVTGTCSVNSNMELMQPICIEGQNQPCPMGFCPCEPCGPHNFTGTPYYYCGSQ